jgi:hypothetical protein
MLQSQWCVWTKLLIFRKRKNVRARLLGFLHQLFALWNPLNLVATGRRALPARSRRRVATDELKFTVACVFAVAVDFISAR